MYIILVYDLKQVNDYAFVQRHVFNICKRYMRHVQNSVFEGELSISQISRLKIELQKYLRKDIDSCIIFKSRSKKWLEKEFVTNQIEENEQFI